MQRGMVRAMSASANTYNITVTEHDVRLTFLDNRPQLTSNNPMVQPSPQSQISEVVAEVVISRALFDMICDQGPKIVENHEKMRQAADTERGRVDN